MYTSIDKAIVGAILGVIYVLQAYNVGLPAFLTTENVQAIIGVLTPLLVYIIPNKT